MKKIDPQAVFADFLKEFRPAFIGESWKRPCLCVFADKCAEQKHKKPRDKRKIIGGRKIFGMKTEWRRNIRGEQNIG